MSFYAAPSDTLALQLRGPIEDHICRCPRVVVFALLAACSGMSLHAQAPPAKNPLLKLAQPWPDAEQMLKRKADAEALRLFAAEDPDHADVEGRLQDDQPRP